MRIFSRLGPALLAATLALLPLGGCTGTDPGDPASTQPEDGAATFDGSVNPGGSSFVLQRIEQPSPPEVAPIFVELIGSNLVVDADNGLVELDVAVRNASNRSLYPPAYIFVGRFDPVTVTVLNPDLEINPITGDLTKGFDYSELLGDVGVLLPGETSGSKTWKFSDPDLVAFSFGARAQFSLMPDRAHISGIVFFDQNTNGQLDPDESPWPGAPLTLDGPEGVEQHTNSGEDGRYVFYVATAGLYRVTLGPTYFQSPAECFTTPMPLEVLLTEGPDGKPNSYDDAHVGFLNGPCAPPLGKVVMTDLDAARIGSDPYRVIDVTLAGDRLWLLVGYSACQPEHPFILYISRNFMESEPVQTWSLLSYDDLGEACRVPEFQRWLAFDLDPLREEYQQAYGHPGQVILRFVDYLGNEHRFLFGP